MQREVIRRNEVLALAPLRLLSGAGKLPWRVLAPRHRIAQVLPGRRTVRSKALASVS